MYEDLHSSILCLCEYLDRMDFTRHWALQQIYIRTVLHFLSWHGNLNVMDYQTIVFVFFCV